jgi:hypothetical protein
LSVVSYRLSVRQAHPLQWVGPRLALSSAFFFVTDN